MDIDPRPAGQPDHPSGKPSSRRGFLWVLRSSLVASGVAFLAVGAALLLDDPSMAGQSAQAPIAGNGPRAAVEERAALPQVDPGEVRLLRVRSHWAASAASPSKAAAPVPEVVTQPPAPVAPSGGAPPAAVEPPAPAPPPQVEAPSGGAAPAPASAEPAQEAAPPPPPPSPAPTATPAPVTAVAPVALSAKEAEFLSGLNAERVRAGLRPLALDPTLVNAARYRSADMAANNYFSHTGSDGRTVFDLLDGWGVSYAWAGENLARNNYPDDQAVSVALRELMASPPHRENILNPNYTRVGVGYARDGSGMHYLTTVFAG